MRRKKPKLRKRTVNFLRGFTTLALLIIIVILGSIMLVGGIFPKMPESTGDQAEGIIDQSSLPSGSHDSLQLQTLKFKKCAETVTVDLLLDHTGSMSNQTPSGESKINRLKEAVLGLAGKLSDMSVIGIQSFNSGAIQEEVPVSYFKDVRDLIPERINALQATGTTPTYDALKFSYGVLQQALPKFPDRKFNFVLVSDGQPVPYQANPTESQDPRAYNPNPADQIKALGVNVFALAIYDGAGQSNDPALAELMRSIASSPENYLEARSADDAVAILSSITEKICR